jgi:hypothetical protein
MSFGVVAVIMLQSQLPCYFELRWVMRDALSEYYQYWYRSSNVLSHPEMTRNPFVSSNRLTASHKLLGWLTCE